ncbi:MAG: UDP-N-acetylmuramoyl-L-alanine--D-glutamate ligase [Erysipelotrichaceae bacterium]|nr:UDP-N-acetylmuramoyl-L-alanine--D-glutamate ligase [Erysipelotrichaceae bacterium]
MNLENKKVLVLGLAKSGLAAIRVLNHLNAKVTLSEIKEITDEDILNEFKQNDVKIVKQEPSILEEGFDLVIKNPGVPLNNTLVLEIEARKIPMITEIELAYLVSRKQNYVAITGSNGKTTTTTLVYELLKKAFGDKALVGGNIGTPLCELVLDNNLFENEGYYIALEMSSAQLVHIDKFKPQLATIINLSPDHIEFHGSLDNYYLAKTRIYKNMDKSDTFIINKDDSLLASYLAKNKPVCNLETISIENQDADNYLKDGYLYVKGEKVLDLSCVKVVGRHNLQNIIIAVTFAKKLNISNEIIADVISDFKGVEHRIEFVREFKGVKYYNDSKGTNTDATITALKAFDKGVILLVGGYEKGLSVKPIKDYLGCVKNVIGYGASGPRIARDLVGDKALIVDDLKQAVKLAYYISLPGDVVLLSPTTSSFDQYKDFEERGEHFKLLVNSL